MEWWTISLVPRPFGGGGGGNKTFFPPPLHPGDEASWTISPACACVITDISFLVHTKSVDLVVR